MSTLISVYDPRYVDRMPSEYLLLIDSQALTIRASSSYHLYISHDFATHSQPVVSLFNPFSVWYAKILAAALHPWFYTGLIVQNRSIALGLVISVQKYHRHGVLVAEI
ncbi:predicted protein [Botrytis cinerea T4]|uniref:Uncharacterized protein n=1 Tax=Botryotinia fuckeliana (strain T4) TaxID=999810 RepID=G2Y9L1_BOTF4|nr:predicted protein [Botrytis cinerea T4]